MKVLQPTGLRSVRSGGREWLGADATDPTEDDRLRIALGIGHIGRRAPQYAVRYCVVCTRLDSRAWKSTDGFGLGRAW